MRRPPAQIETDDACVECLGDGIVITRYSVTGSSVYCVRCGSEVGELDFDNDLVTENW